MNGGQKEKSSPNQIDNKKQSKKQGDINDNPGSRTVSE